MNLSEYQSKAYKFAAYEYPDYPFMALPEEVGEVCGKLAKFGRKTNNSLANSITYAAAPDCPTEQKLKDDLVLELGDVLWQLSACCQELGVGLDQVAEKNLEKLSGRLERGTVVGEGDVR